MNTEEKDNTVSKALSEVWEWKEKASNELMATPKEKRMLHIKENTQAVIDAILLKKKIAFNKK